jgi:hypothetical protein
MPSSAWKQLLAGAPWFQGDEAYPIAAYSEFMPPPRLAVKPYGSRDFYCCAERDPWGWPVTEYEEAFQLRPGLAHLARQLVGALVHLGHGEAAHGIAHGKLAENPYWPPELARLAGALPHERYVALMPLALSRTQDDKGRVRWTLFGGSEQGPERAFWQSFFVSPGREAPPELALDFVRRLLTQVYGEHAAALGDLRRAGFRILPSADGANAEAMALAWPQSDLPSWTEPYLWTAKQSLRGVKYLLTFRPFGRLPAPVQAAYAAGTLHLLPFPGSLVFWGAPPYAQLLKELPLSMQIPLLHSVVRLEAPFGIRVPQSGWLHEPRPGHPGPGVHGPIRNTFRRTHRWARVHRDEDELAVESREEKLLHVLFSTSPDDMGLYDKPLARNVQLWTRDLCLLLDGPNADAAAIKKAEHAVLSGGLFGYRFQYPAMRVGLHELYWHRPLAAYFDSNTSLPAVIDDAPTGFLTAYPAKQPDPARPVMLWPRLLARNAHRDAVRLFEHVHDPRPHVTSRNVRKLLDVGAMFAPAPLPSSLARQLLCTARNETLDDWLDRLPERASSAQRGRELTQALRAQMAPARVGSRPARLPKPLTFARTARRAFEVAYWKTIAKLAEGRYVNKDNADCVRDTTTQKLLTHQQRDLEALGDYLLAYYARQVAAAGMKGKALVGDLPFRWRTDYDFGWMGGWLKNQKDEAHERDMIVVIPGRDRTRAVIMADHYDTAYMADHYEKDEGGNGARLAASGADDNHSATVALMLGAPVFLALSRAGRLACDIWLVHLTGEEFPADCLGARYLAQQAVQRTLRMRLAAGAEHDLSGVRLQGVYVLDMVAHNNDRARDIFQIAPGTTSESLWLAYQAHIANEVWNARAPVWNQKPARRNAGRGRRSPHGGIVPETARHPTLSGEVRLAHDPRSTLYNTDGQIFSDAGIPVVLFMENYDINRSGYHDSHDTMANIDLDYGAAVAAIAIEAVARAATEKPGFAPAAKRARARSR